MAFLPTPTWLRTYRRRPTHGLNDLPKVPGIYAIYDRANRKFYIGWARRSIYRRCRKHYGQIMRGVPESPLMRGVLERGGTIDPFFFVLEPIPYDPALGNVRFTFLLNRREAFFSRQFRAFDEECGYMLRAGGLDTPSKRLRKWEEFVSGCRWFGDEWEPGFQYLEGVNSEDPIRSVLVDSWIRGHREPNFFVDDDDNADW